MGKINECATLGQLFEYFGRESVNCRCRVRSLAGGELSVSFTKGVPDMTIPTGLLFLSVRNIERGVGCMGEDVVTVEVFGNELNDLSRYEKAYILLNSVIKEVGVVKRYGNRFHLIDRNGIEYLMHESEVYPTKEQLCQRADV
jgi:hypothetical protein